MIDNGAAATDPVQLPTPSEFEAPWRTILIDVALEIANRGSKHGPQERLQCSVGS